MTDDDNPYLGQTREIPRPTHHQSEFQMESHSALRLAQRLWDVAESVRAELAAAEVSALAARDEHQEEPVSKAVENRLRVAFLASKGATMQMWIAQRDEILSRQADIDAR